MKIKYCNKIPVPANVCLIPPMDVFTAQLLRLKKVFFAVHQGIRKVNPGICKLFPDYLIILHHLNTLLTASMRVCTCSFW